MKFCKNCRSFPKQNICGPFFLIDLFIMNPYPIYDQNGQHRYSIYDQNDWKSISFGAAHTSTAQIREYLPHSGFNFPLRALVFKNCSLPQFPVIILTLGIKMCVEQNALQYMKALVIMPSQSQISTT